MCGRFTLTTPEFLDEFTWHTNQRELFPRYNIAPTQEVVAIREGELGREKTLLRWGLIPAWAKDASGAARMINARSETVATKPSFRDSFKMRRCLIPSDGWYEWQRVGPRNKQPYHIRMSDRSPFMFAGLWANWGRGAARIESCTIVTTEANASTRFIHDRMPVIIDRQDFDHWLSIDISDAVVLEPLLAPYSHADLEAVPVGKAVGNVRNDSPECVERVAPLDGDDVPDGFLF